MAGWCVLSVSCVCSPLLLVWFGLVWMREGSPLINNTCARGELYIKLVCRLTQATCCGFLCGWSGNAGLSDPDSSNKDTLGTIQKSFDQLAPSVEPKQLIQRVCLCDQSIYDKAKPRFNLFPTMDTSFRNKIIILFCFKIISCVTFEYFIQSFWLSGKRSWETNSFLQAYLSYI